MNFFEIGGHIIACDDHDGPTHLSDPRLRQVLAAGEQKFSEIQPITAAEGKSISEIQLEVGRRSRETLIEMIDAAPRALPGTGPLGMAWNFVKRAPGLFIDIQQYSMTPRMFYEFESSIVYPE
ncbi:MAG: hypothetical protein [Circular genetic element sp.]|nr:MAG: hypothetical protein [Circular genetic element sp.]